MTITLEEQIEYIREQITFACGKVFFPEESVHSERAVLTAILATLEAVRDARNAKVTP